jgi:putative ABC transport system ATP-binding protein
MENITHTSVLKTRDLSKEYRVGEVITRALGGVSIEVREGEFVAIEGRSGSGKSTLLHMLSLLDRPSGGDVLVNGRETAHFSRKERVHLRLSTFGYVFQDYALIPELTALENVLLPHFMKTGCYRTCSSRGTDLLERVGLSNRLHNLPNQLSGGEQQRVAIARALVNDPEVLFADEPTANLDSDTSETIMDIFDELHKKGLTLIMVTHEPEYSARAERTIRLADGILVS